MKIIFGWGVNYGELLKNGVIESLYSRRETNCLKFARKAAKDVRFGHRWFPRVENERSVRPTTRKIFAERRYKTERGRSNPLEFMVRLLNEHGEE